MGAYYHVSTTLLSSGTVLQPRWFTGGIKDHILRILEDAMTLGPMALRLVLLCDDLITCRLRPDAEKPRAASDLALPELIFERVRKAEYNDRPSRIGSIFVFAEHAFAERFQTQFRNGQGEIFPCQTSPEAQRFQADMKFINAVSADPHKPIEEQVALFEESARLYWSGAMTREPWPEVIVQGNVTVI